MWLMNMFALCAVMILPVIYCAENNVTQPDTTSSPVNEPTPNKNDTEETAVLATVVSAFINTVQNRCDFLKLEFETASVVSEDYDYAEVKFYGKKDVVVEYICESMSCKKDNAERAILKAVATSPLRDPNVTLSMDCMKAFAFSLDTLVEKDSHFTWRRSMISSKH